MELETVFYVLGIIFMSLMLVIILSLAVGVFMIKKKIDYIHAAIEDKLAAIASIFEIGKQGTEVVRNVVRKARS
jgi:hypothetical protein